MENYPNNGTYSYSLDYLYRAFFDEEKDPEWKKEEEEKIMWTFDPTNEKSLDKVKKIKEKTEEVIEKIDDTAKKEVNKHLDSSLDTSKIDQLFVVQGGKSYRLKVDLVEELPVEEAAIKNVIEKIKENNEKRINTITKYLKDRATTNINATEKVLSSYITHAKYKLKSLKESEKKLEEERKNLRAIPNISEIHLEQGLSVALGNRKDILIWNFRGLFSIKYVDGKPINIKTMRRNTVPVIIRIVTENNTITDISLRKIINYQRFTFHHGDSSFVCWGSWDYPKEWKTPQDIINVANDALKVLENVHGSSVLMENPPGLSSLRVLRNNVKTDNFGTPKKTQTENAMGFEAKVPKQTATRWRSTDGPSRWDEIMDEPF